MLAALAIFFALLALGALVVAVLNLLPDMTPEQREAWKRERAENEKQEH